MQTYRLRIDEYSNETGGVPPKAFEIIAFISSTIQDPGVNVITVGVPATEIVIVPDTFTLYSVFGTDALTKEITGGSTTPAIVIGGFRRTKKRDLDRCGSSRSDAFTRTSFLRGLLM